MAFQATVRQELTGGFVGDIVIDGAVRAQTGVLKTTTVANNVIGRVVTHVADNDGQFEVGGTGAFAGILSSKNQQALKANGLTPSLALPNNVPVEAVTLTSGIIVELTSSGDIGDGVAYDEDGKLVAAPAGVAPEDTTLIKNAKIVRQNIPSAGLAIIELTE